MQAVSYPEGGLLAGEGAACRAPMEVSQQKEEAAGSERESACVHTAWIAPPNMAPFEMALPQKVGLDSATNGCSWFTFQHAKHRTLSTSSALQT